MPKLSSTKKPLATKVARKLASATKQKVLDLDSIRQGHAVADELKESAPKAEQYADFHPAHAMYVDALDKSPRSPRSSPSSTAHRISDAINAAEDEYVPGGPPMSPVTDSFFITWSLFDCGVGIERETDWLRLDRSRSVDGHGRRFPRRAREVASVEDGTLRPREAREGGRSLREVVTGVVIEAVNPTGYEGTASNLWYARVSAAASASVQTAHHRDDALRDHGAAKGRLAHISRAHASEDKALQPEERLRAPHEVGPVEQVLARVRARGVLQRRPRRDRVMGLPDVAESRPNSRLNHDDAGGLRRYVESGRIMTGNPP